MRLSLPGRLSHSATALSLCSLSFLLACPLAVAQTKTLHVSLNGPTDFHTVQQAVDAAPDGAEIVIAPGIYRGTVKVHQAHLLLRGATSDPAATVIIANTSRDEVIHTLDTATVSIFGDDVHVRDLTIQNDYNQTHKQAREGSQALALLILGDRTVLTDVRVLANQDTLYVGSKDCGPNNFGGRICTTARAYFSGCEIAGNIDFIYGSGKVVFDHCEIHSTPHRSGFLTAQDKTYPTEESGFIFNHCRLTADPGVANVHLSRPGRSYATVVFLNTWMGAQIVPAGWEWKWKPTDQIVPNFFYAEFHSTGPGANPSARDPHSHQLTAAETKPFETRTFLAGADHWDPTAGASN